MNDERVETPKALEPKRDQKVTWKRPAMRVVPASRSEFHIGVGNDSTHGLS